MGRQLHPLCEKNCEYAEGRFCQWHTCWGSIWGFWECQGDLHYVFKHDMADGTIASAAVYTDIEAQRQNPAKRWFFHWWMDLINKSVHRVDEREVVEQLMNGGFCRCPSTSLYTAPLAMVQSAMPSNSHSSFEKHIPGIRSTIIRILLQHTAIQRGWSCQPIGWSDHD